MSSHTSVPNPGPHPPLDSLPYVQEELKRIPARAKRQFQKLGLREDLEQELHLAYYTVAPKTPELAKLKRALHAAGERMRYREVVRRAKYEVPEELAGAAYHRLMYGTEPDKNGNDN